MNEIRLKYGCNQIRNHLEYVEDGSDLPVLSVNGKPGYIDFLDAFNGWQLVKEQELGSSLQLHLSMFHDGWQLVFPGRDTC